MTASFGAFTSFSPLTMGETLTPQQLRSNSYHLAIRSSLLAIQSTLFFQETMLQSQHATFTDIKATIASQNSTLQNTTKALVELFSKISSFQPPPAPPTPLSTAAAGSTTLAPTSPKSSTPPPSSAAATAVSPHLILPQNHLPLCPTPPTPMPAIVAAAAAAACHSSAHPTPPLTKTPLSTHITPITQVLMSNPSPSASSHTPQPINPQLFLLNLTQNNNPAPTTSWIFHQTPQALAPKSLLEKLTVDLALSNSMNMVSEFQDQYTLFLPFENDSFRLRENKDLLNIRQHIVYAEKNYPQCQNTSPILQKTSDPCTALIPILKIISNSLKNKICGERKIDIFDPGGTFMVESIFDLEDKIYFKGMVMIRCSHDACNTNLYNPRQHHYMK